MLGLLCCLNQRPLGADVQKVCLANFCVSYPVSNPVVYLRGMALCDHLL